MSPTPPLSESQIYPLIGEEGFTRLTAAFYRLVAADAVLGPMYRAALAASGETMGDAEQKLRGFLVYRFGGPDTYVQTRGHPRLRARHMPFRIDLPAADRWMQLMESALAQSAIPVEAVALLRPYFRSTADMMVNS